jgi:hypothetical protein
MATILSGISKLLSDQAFKGIQLAKFRGIYKGRINGAKTSPSTMLDKYQKISDLIDRSDLSVRRIAGITGHSVNTVRKIKQLKEI